MGTTDGIKLPARYIENVAPAKGNEDGNVNIINVPAATRAGKVADTCMSIAVDDVYDIDMDGRRR